MTKQNIKTAIRSNPRARRHEKAILDALRAVEKLAASGLPGEGYDLASPYGGKVSTPPRPALTKSRMTYCSEALDR
jgi:hypothetical protein